MKLNKLFTGFAALAILTLFLGCASTDDGVKEVVFDSGDSKTSKNVDAEDEQEINEEDALLVTTDIESSYKIESDAALNAKESKKNYTGWVSTAIRPITNTVGNIKLNVRPKKGTFSIAVVGANDKGIPVLSTANEYTTTSLYLKAGKKILKLCDDSNVVSAAKKTAKGVAIRYTIERTAVVQLELECIASVEGEKEDTVKLTATVQNIGKKKNDFALKFLLDTVLGETDRHHFYTSEDLPVKGEVLYRTMKDDKWIVSKNAKATMQIILDGADVTPIESVALANFTTLDTKKWEADMTVFRSFDTVLSYNNSAVGIYWPKSSLEPEQVQTQIFYISIASGEEVPGGAAYITGQPVQKASEKTKETPTESVQTIKAEPVTEVIKTEPQTTDSKPEAQKPETRPEPQKTETKPVKEETKPQTTSSISDDKLSLDYIQALLDKIESLEEGDPEVNKEEINALNAELDAIITILNAR